MEALTQQLRNAHYEKILRGLLDTYRARTPKNIQIIDLFLVYIFFTGVLQFLYMALFGQFPFNAFLSGFGSAIGSFVLVVALRLQVTHRAEFYGISLERVYAEFVICNIILHFVVLTFIG